MPQAHMNQNLRYTLLYRQTDRKSTRLNSSHANISYAVFCLKKKKTIPYMLIYIQYHAETLVILTARPDNIAQLKLFTAYLVCNLLEDKPTDHTFVLQRRQL